MKVGDLLQYLENHPDLHPRGKVDAVKLRLENPEKEVEAYKYSMENYLSKCVDKYCEMAAFPRERMPAVATPFEDEAKEPRGCVKSDTMASENVGRDSKRRKPAARLHTIREDEGAPSAGHAAVGELNRAAASVIMTVMFAARWARADLLRAIGFLASNLHEWGETQDRRLFRLMCYINNTLQLRLIAFIGDKPDDLKLVAYSDADFAGDRRDSKSTSGAFMVLWGKHSYFP